jgi:hypothetical protein
VMCLYTAFHADQAVALAPGLATHSAGFSTRKAVQRCMGAKQHSFILTLHASLPWFFSGDFQTSTMQGAGCRHFRVLTAPLSHCLPIKHGSGEAIWKALVAVQLLDRFQNCSASGPWML